MVYLGVHGQGQYLALARMVYSPDQGRSAVQDFFPEGHVLKLFTFVTESFLKGRISTVDLLVLTSSY